MGRRLTASGGPGIAERPLRSFYRLRKLFALSNGEPDQLCCELGDAYWWEVSRLAVVSCHPNVRIRPPSERWPSACVSRRDGKLAAASPCSKREAKGWRLQAPSRPRVPCQPPAGPPPPWAELGAWGKQREQRAGSRQSPTPSEGRAARPRVSCHRWRTPGQMQEGRDRRAVPREAMGVARVAVGQSLCRRRSLRA